MGTLRLASSLVLTLSLAIAGCAGNAVLGPLDGASGEGGDVAIDHGGNDVTGDLATDTMGGDAADVIDAGDVIDASADSIDVPLPIDVPDVIVPVDVPLDGIVPIDVPLDGIIPVDVPISVDVPLDGIVPTDVLPIDVTTDTGTTDTGTTDAGTCSTPVVSCYSGPAGTQGVGVCRAGAQFCIGGMLSACSGEVTPNTEACNGLDDDCDGTVDDGLGTISCGVGACQNTVNACTAGIPSLCIPGLPTLESCNGIDDDCDGAIDEDGCNCIHVSPLGLDLNPGTAIAPMRTINAAIMRAAMTGPPIVCVAAGLTCVLPGDYAEDVVMANGVSVYGGYQATGVTWPRVPACVTRILPQTAAGVVFPATVSMPTILDGFTINGHNDPTNAAISIRGATGAVVNNDIVNGGPGATSIGIDVVDAAGIAATPTISSSAITGGTGTLAAIGIRSANSAPIIRNNCSAFDAAGRCQSFGCFGATNFIRGRAAGSTGTVSTGIRLENSVNALVDTSGICSFQSSTDVHGIRIVGDATGVVIRRNNIDGNGAASLATGILLDPCNGASPRIENNFLVTGHATTAMSVAQGIRAVGDCHPVIDSNVRILGGDEGAAADSTAIACLRDTVSGAPSRCTVTNNTDILGAGAGFPPRSVGIACDVGACNRIERNTRISGRGGIVSIGVLLDVTGTLVNDNGIDGGCGTNESIGLYSRDSYSRVQNNVILGSVCPTGTTTMSSYAVRVGLTDTVNELDLHSNDLVGTGQASGCTSRALTFEALLSRPPPTQPRGIVRNNLLFAGNCPTNFDIAETSAAADPRIVQNNILWFTTGSVTALYRDENATNITTIAGVNALADITSANNLSADPLVNATFHIPAASPARNAGTASGAPTTDYDNDMRPLEAAFDIGADEFRP